VRARRRHDDPERYAKSFVDPARDGWQMPSRVIEVLALSPDASVAERGIRQIRRPPRETARFATAAASWTLEKLAKIVCGTSLAFRS
jgi:hypothetical protein